MDWLKKLLGEELYNQVMPKLGDTKIVVDNGDLIPKHRFQEVIDQRDQAQAIADKQLKDIQGLQQVAAGNEQLTLRVRQIETESATAKVQFERDLTNSKKQLAIKEALLNAGVIDPEARNLLALKFNVDKIELNQDGTPSGFDSLLAPIKENKTFAPFFGEIKIAGQESHSSSGRTPDLSLGEWANKNPFKKETLNMTEQIKLRRDQPDLAKRLEAAAMV